MLDLVRQGEMSSDSVTFARQDAHTPAAAATAEATSTSTGTKPEASMALTVVTASASTYASWVPVTRRALSDTAEVRALVDTRLVQDARQALETALLASVNTDAAQSQARGADAHTLAVLKAITLLRSVDSEPSAVVVTPATYESAVGRPRGVSAAATATVAFVADRLAAAAVWYRDAEDITRKDGLGRTRVVVPAGTVPARWVQLTNDERASLVEPAPPPPDGWLEPGHAGFTPRNARVGFTIDLPGNTQ